MCCTWFSCLFSPLLSRTFSLPFFFFPWYWHFGQSSPVVLRNVPLSGLVCFFMSRFWLNDLARLPGRRCGLPIVSHRSPRSSGCLTLGHAKFELLCRTVTTRSLHCKGIFSPLWFIGNLRDDILRPCEFPVHSVLSTSPWWSLPEIHYVGTSSFLITFFSWLSGPDFIWFFLTFLSCSFSVFLCFLPFSLTFVLML